MTIREQLELRELEYLSSYAALSKDSKGRKRKEEPCDIRPAFQRDRDRILHCKAFRRLKQWGVPPGEPPLQQKHCV